MPDYDMLDGVQPDLTATTSANVVTNAATEVVTVHVPEQSSLTITPPESTLAASSTAQNSPLGYLHRRGHRKSRTGCQTCKSRKIKCDERHPACLNCIAHGAECPFLHQPRENLKTSSKKSPISSKPATPGPDRNPSIPLLCASSDSGSDILPLLELELLHNFTIHTYSTLTADEHVADFWRTTVVQIGLRCDYIMRAVLAVSALHLAYHRPEKRDFYTAHGIEFHRRASRSAMQLFHVVSATDTDNAANLFLFSMMTIYFALASPRLSLPDGSFTINHTKESDTDPGAGFPDWTFLLNGAKSISRVLGSRGQETNLEPFLTYGAKRWHATRGPEDPSSSSSSSSSNHLPSNPDAEAKAETEATCQTEGKSRATDDLLLLATLRAHIDAAMSPSPHSTQLGGDPLPPEERAALHKTYAHALDELEIALIARQDPHAPRDVLDAMLWLWEVADSLVPLLKTPRRTPEAVVIFAHFCILLKHHESVWWLQGWGEHLIASAWEVLDETRRGWIGWPVRVVGWVPGPT
ncbi:hypothetical protein B0T22DRAFT_177160 [Podospora appendiculata]|uniref:Zn(2)-C6 fungal-type domain-containing protein n=1 Tax=Podospora appendiculata TaxID=314037 RepID=A0AAE0XCH1_9PEZI|nr:hypothetical protein B0T22DRAFT_177160 [Podospora appendiculata]